MPPQMVDHSRVGARHNTGILLSTPGDPQESTASRVKCVLVGDGAIGKTSLVVSYTTNGYPTEYVPTAFDNYTVVVTVDNKPIRLQLCDTAGQLQGGGDEENQDDFDSLRPLCYPNTDIFLLCFSVVSPTSFHNLTEKWLAEIRHHCPKSPIVIVGTQCDLRNDVKVLIELAHYNERPVTEAEAKHLVNRIGALTYIECSALTQRNLKEVFDTAILASLDRKGILEQPETVGKGKKKSKQKKSDKNGDHWNNIHPKKKDCKHDKQKKGWKKFCCFV